jgi:glycosyltransferase involved in cell wall biosynthesis
MLDRLQPGSRLVAIVSSAGNLAEAARLVSRAWTRQCQVTALCFDVVAFEFLQSLDVSLDYADSLASRYTLAMEHETIKLSRTWCVVQGEDTSLWKGVSFGSIAALDVQWSLREPLRKIDVVLRFFSNNHPDAVLVATDENRLILKILHSTGYQGGVLTIPPTARQKAKAMASLDSWIHRLRSWNWDWATRVFLSMLLMPFLRGSRGLERIQRARVLVVVDVPTPSMMRATLPIVNRLEDEALVLAVDPRVALILDRLGQSFTTLGPFFSRRAWSEFLEARKFFTERWKAYGEEILKRAQCGEAARLALKPVFGDYFRRVYTRQFPLQAMERMLLRALVEREDVRSIVVASDFHHMGRLSALVGAQMDVPSVVVQHGATMEIDAFGPVIATRMAVWGDISRRWLIDHGAQANRLVVTGPPQFDQLTQRKKTEQLRNSVCRRLGLDPDRVILTLAVIQLAGREMVEMALEAMGALRDFQLVVKLHPGERDEARLMDLVTGLGLPNAIAVKHFDIYDLLEISDIVIVWQSTVGLEALILGKPLIAFRFDMPAPVPFAEYGAAVQVRSAEELVDAVRRVSTDKELRAALMQGRDSFVRSYIGEADGRATDRVIELIDKLVASQMEAVADGAEAA